MDGRRIQGSMADQRDNHPGGLVAFKRPRNETGRRWSACQRSAVGGGAARSIGSAVGFRLVFFLGLVVRRVELPDRSDDFLDLVVVQVVALEGEGILDLAFDPQVDGNVRLLVDLV